MVTNTPRWWAAGDQRLARAQKPGEYEGKVNVTETIIGIMGELMLLLTVAFLVVAVATMVLALEEYPKEYLAIGTPFVVAAGAMYTARGYLEQRQWKRLSMTTLIVATALTISAVGTSDATGATVWQTAWGFFWVLASAIFVLLFVYVFRIAYLFKMYLRKRTIVESVQAGKYSEAVKVAEGRQSGVGGADYVKRPEMLSYSVALALACALEKVERGKDAERVRLVSESRNPLRR
ncbi:MAG: hypothetical protein F4X66_20050 [Chloroflexi bacterium]|nr:hypothetical protein [Chloroflexota bacterium]